MTGVWVTNDTISATRMNEKTIFQGTGAAISGLTTYAGMLAFCTSTGSGFTADTLYQRNSANTSWSPAGTDHKPYLTLSTTIGDYTSSAAVTGSSGAVQNVPSDASDSFGTDTWNDVGTDYGVSGGVLNWKAKREVADHLTWKDLTGATVSDTKWFMRFKIVLTTHTNSTGLGCYTWFVMSDNSSGGEGTSQDYLGMGYKAYDGIDEVVFAADGNGVALEAVETGGYAEFTGAVTRYVELERISATSFRVETYSDSTFTTSIGSHNATVSSSITGLRYFKIVSWNQSTSTFNGTIIGYIDDLQFWDGKSKAEVGSGWETTSEATPSVYFDFTSDREIVSNAVKLNTSNTTVTAIKVRASTDTTFTDSENIAYLTVSDFTNNTWRYIANNFISSNRRYVQFIGVGTGVLSIYDMKARYGVSDLVKIMNHRHRTRNVDAADSFVDSN